jgi:hypothetical protein
MKTASRICFQGDVCFVRVDEIPEGFTQTKTGERLTVAHSETGHNHDVMGIDMALYENPRDPMICYLSFGGESVDAIHLRDTATHETWRLLGDLAKKTTYKIVRQREYTPEGWRRVED